MTIRPVRRPLDGLDPDDLDTVQRRAIARANEDVLRRGRVPQRMVLICDDHVEEVDLDRATGGDPVATFESLAHRSDVVHRMLVGCAEDPDGPGRIAFVFGAANDESRSWWLATRKFTRLPGGVGSAERAWDVVSDVELETLPAPVATLVREGSAWTVMPARALPWPTIGCRVDEAPLGAMPLDPLAATRVVAQRGHEVEAWQHGPDAVLVVVFRAGMVEKWHVKGEIPCGLDDLVRAVCQMGEAPTAVATLQVDLFDHQGTLLPAIRTVAEAGGERIERVLAMTFGADDRRPSDLRLFGTRPEQVGPDRWIGVKPAADLELSALVAEA